MSTKTSGDLSPSDRDKHGAESDTRTAPGAPPTNPVEEENDLNTSETEVRDLQERLRGMESKMASVDKLYNLHKSTAEAMEFSNEDPTSVWQYTRLPQNEKVSFYTDVLFFMRKLRLSHQQLVRTDMINKQRREALKKADPVKEDSQLERLSLDAFMNDQRIKPMQMDWEEYLPSSMTLEEFQLMPVAVISGEPDSRSILQFASSESRFTKGDAPKRLHIERNPPNIEDSVPSEPQPLPERIWIRSKELITILFEASQTRRTAPGIRPPPLPNDRVLLRPYQELFHREQYLRDWLSVLEKRFEHHRTMERSSSPSRLIPGDGSIGQERADASDSTPSAFEATQSVVLASDQANQEKRLERNETTAGNGVVGSPNPIKDHDDGASEDDAPEDKDEPNEDPHWKNRHSITALVHLRCLMEFIDKELKPKQQYISSNRCTHVHFHDLWHLFKPGDEIIQQDRRQAFIVLRAQVPRHRVHEPWNRWSYDDASTDSSGSDSESDGDKDGDGDEDGDGPFTVHCAYIDFDGKSFGTVPKKFKISPFDEPKPIKSLPVYPIRFINESESRRELVDRGRKLLEVSRFKSMYYTGVTLDKRDEIDSQVVVDFSEALADDTRRKLWEPTVGTLKTSGDKLGSRCRAICCVPRNVSEGFHYDAKSTEEYIKSLFPDTLSGGSSLILQPRSSEEVLGSPGRLTETELLIMTYRVFGFVLRSRKWAQLDLSLLRHENANARLVTVNAFDSLELPDNHREVLKSLVVQHFRSKQSALMSNEQTDLIQGKGKGLILLLHGAPGVGKTTTAEGIAQLFKRPLFQITCGDLGTTAGEVEAELEKNFSLASRWGCILLLDEADVFLSARERMDFKRNGLVAVFLRVLEYYSGILFLTTNRIGDFDEAFSSRIHMSLYYPPLDEESTWKVFKLNLDLIKKRLNGQGRNITFDESAIEKFARNHFLNHEFNRWNGRQIRNACQTALALADFDSQGGSLEIDGEIDKHAVVQLQLKYFETVQKAYLDFGEYLGDIQGTHGDSRAIDYKLRARKDTPYQQKRNAFSQHGNSRPGRGQRSLFPEYPHGQRSFSNVSESNFGSQGDQFNQGYAPTTPNPNTSRSQGYDPYSSHPGSMHSSQGQPRGASMANRDPYDRSSEGGQQYQSDQRFSQGGARGQRFESPRMSDRIIPSVEEDRYASPGYDDSPLPHRPAQRPSQTHGYDSPNEGDIAQSRNPVQGPSSYNPNSIFRSRRDDIGN